MLVSFDYSAVHLRGDIASLPLAEDLVTANDAAIGWVLAPAN
jgi:hypothetical protein